MPLDPDDDRTLNPGGAGPPSPSSSEQTERRGIATPINPDPARVQLDAEDRFQARELLGQGGVGEVWRAQDVAIEREVAIKRLRSTAPRENDIRRFIREAKLQGQIEHPAVVPVHDLGQGPDGHPYFVMRRIRGQTLKEILEQLARDREDQPRYSRRKLLTAFSSVCLAVHYAHSQGVIHRDLKPENVMLGDFGEVYLLDWGVAMRLASTESEGIAEPLDSGRELDPSLTGAGNVLGTPAYMAPE
jgi:eukaryotic-like serine/threonine-protein kinase